MEYYKIDKETKILLLKALQKGYFETEEFRLLQKNIGMPQSTPEESARFLKEFLNESGDTPLVQISDESKVIIREAAKKGKLERILMTRLEWQQNLINSGGRYSKTDDMIEYDVILKGIMEKPHLRVLIE